MSAHMAKQTAISTTIAELHCPEQLIVWAIRHWLDGSHDWPAIQQVFWQACGIVNVEAALQDFQEMIGILSTSSRRTLYFHRPACRCVSADELTILNLIFALQADRSEHAKALVCWLVPLSLGNRLLGAATCLSNALQKSGNVFTQIGREPLSALAIAGTA